MKVFTMPVPTGSEKNKSGNSIREAAAWLTRNFDTYSPILIDKKSFDIF